MKTNVDSPLAPTSSPRLKKSSPGPVVSRSGFARERRLRLHDALARHVARGTVPGLVALVSHRGREHVEVIGRVGADDPVPMTRDAIFRLASTTKPITAVAAMILVEECKLRLDDPIDEWLPELSHRRVLRDITCPLDDTVPASRAITLRDLLTFRSGYGEVAFISPTCPLQQAMVDAQLPLSTWPFPHAADEFMRRLGALPLAFQPGERWLYHMSAEILGVLIARVSGTSLGQFLRERIFDPLGMKDTGFHVPSSQLHRLPPCDGTDLATGRRVLLEPAAGGYASRRPAFESGAGGLVSTADDLLAFGRMMLSGPSAPPPRILSRPTIELMTTDQLSPAQKANSPFFANFWASYGWGLGLGVVTARTDLALSPGRFGWDGAFGTSWHVDPREDLVGVLMVQRRPDQLAISPLAQDFWTSVYQLIAT